MNKKVYVAIAAIVLISLACTLSPVTQPSSPTTSGGQSSNVLFQDDFSNTNSGWSTRSNSGDSMDYSNGAFRIYLNSTMTDLVSQAGKSLPADVVIDVDVTKAGGSDNNDFGVTCRMKDLNNFYFFEAASDGYAVIGKFLDNTMSYLSAEAMAKVDGINAGSTLNHIRAECVGSNLKLYVNGKLVAQTTDTTFTSGGDVGLIAGSFSDGGIDILFDNFVVSKP
jgi:hypothetical protein